MSDDAPNRDPRRWRVVVAFLLAAGLTQAVWLNDAPLVSFLEERYGISEDTAGLPILVFPLLYVVLSIPSGLLIDRRGYRWTLRAAVVAMAVLALARALDLGFVWLVLLQAGLAVVQPFVVNVISKLVLDWFEPDEAVLATGLGTMGMFLGMAAGLAATPPMVHAWGYEGAMFAWGLVAVAIGGLCFAWIEEHHGRGGSVAVGGVRAMLRERPLVLTWLLALLGLGYFNGLTTWLEPIVAPNGLDADQAGLAGGVLVVGGIVGAVAIPAAADVVHRRKPFVVGSVLAALLTLAPVVVSRSPSVVYATAALQGFFFLPAFALLLDICAALAGEARAGSATGMLMLAGNGGGVLVIVAMALLRDGTGTWDAANILLGGLLFVAAVGAMFLPETGAGTATG